MKNEALYIVDSHQMEIRSIEIPKLKPDQVLIKTRHVGICGSDLHFYDNARPEFKARPWELPIVVGHEVAGEVVEVGSAVTGLQVGDLVAAEPGVPCGHCDYCRRGMYNLCRNMQFISSPPNIGAFRRYFSHPANLCYKLPENVSTLEGALIEPLAVGLHACELADVKLGNTVVVFGSGCIGLVNMMAAKARGASTVIVIDIFDKRLEKAKELGADFVINSKKTDPVAEVWRLLGDGPDIILECAGAPMIVEQCYFMAKADTMIAFVSSMAGEYQYPARAVMLKEVRTVTVFRYRNQYPVAIRAINEGKIHISSIASHIYPFEDSLQAFDEALNNKMDVVKAVIAFD